MICKVLYKNNWHLAKYKDKQLSILKETALDNFDILQQRFKNFNNELIAPALLENGQFYIFNLDSGIPNESSSLFYDIKIKNIDFVELTNRQQYDFDNFNKFVSISFVDGICSPMLEQCAFEPFNININGININVSFSVKAEQEENVCNYTIGGRLLLSDKNLISHYKINLKFSRGITLSEVNDIIDVFYKFIKFFNTDNFPYIGKILLNDGVNELNYFYHKINYYNEIVHRFNYLQNLGSNDILKKAILGISDKKIDVDYLSLFSKEKLHLNDVWILGNSIESIVNSEYKYDDKIKKEIDFLDNLYNEINALINDLQANFKQDDPDISLDKDHLNFIRSSIRMNRFKVKVCDVLKIYNVFAAQHPSSYNTLSDNDRSVIANKIRDLRNSIHGNYMILSKEDEKAIRFMAFCLHLYLLNKVGISEQFNFVQVIAIYPQII